MKVICTFDPALDVHRAGNDQSDGSNPLLDYVKTRDYSLIAPYIRPGERPTIFTVESISRAVMHGRVARANSEYDRYMLSFQYGVQCVEHLIDSDGQLIPQWSPSGLAGHERYCTQDDLERFSPAEVQEIGSVAYQCSFLPARIHAKYALPYGSIEILTRLTK